jgi:hypothetical protein
VIVEVRGGRASRHSCTREPIPPIPLIPPVPRAREVSIVVVHVGCRRSSRISYPRHRMWVRGFRVGIGGGRGVLVLMPVSCGRGDEAVEGDASSGISISDFVDASR